MKTKIIGRTFAFIYLFLGIFLSMYNSHWLVQIGAGLVSFIGGLFFYEAEFLK